MKTLKIASIVTFLVIVGFSISLVSALSSSDATIIASLNNPTPKPGNGVTVNVVFNSNVAQELQIYAVGLHADWMNADGFQGPNLSSNPATVASMSSWSVNFVVTIPVDASVGSHTYYVGVDGVDASGNPFSLNSGEATLQVIAGSSRYTYFKPQRRRRTSSRLTGLATLSSSCSSRSNCCGINRNYSDAEKAISQTRLSAC